MSNASSVTGANANIDDPIRLDHFEAVEAMRALATFIAKSNPKHERLRQFAIPAIGLIDLHINDEGKLQFEVDRSVDWGTFFAIDAAECQAMAQFFVTMSALLGAKS